MPATGTPEEQESNPSAPSSTNSGGASAKQILEICRLPCFDPQGRAEFDGKDGNVLLTCMWPRKE